MERVSRTDINQKMVRVSCPKIGLHKSYAWAS